MLLHSVTLFFLLASSASALDPVFLGTAGHFAILSKSGVTATVGSTVKGNMGTSPIAVTAITGFGLIQNTAGTSSESAMVTDGGRVFGASQLGETPTYLTNAIGDMGIAYLDAEGRLNALHEDLYNGDIGGETLNPGLYKWNGNVKFIGGDVTFEGTADDIWILQIAGIVEAGAGTKVLLTGGTLLDPLLGVAQAKNIFWQVAGMVDVGAGAHLEGIFLVKTHMAFKIGSSLTGAALAQTAVTLDDADIIKESSIEGAAAGPVA